MKTVIKRDGTTVEYNSSKIEKAIQGSNSDVPKKYRIPQTLIVDIRKNIEDYFKHEESVGIEEIQDKVEEQLTLFGNFKLAKAFMVYRAERAMIREVNTTDSSVLSLLENTNEELADENANKNTMIAATQRDYLAGIVSTDLTRRVLLPTEITKAHDEGILHFHDADYFVQPIFNCCLVNIGDMLDNGTVMNGKLIESPKSFQVACTVMTQIIACVCSNQYGGQSVDVRHLGKYLRRSREKIEKKFREVLGDTISEEQLKTLVDAQLQTELKSGVQTIQYQINTLMTTNGQSPFVTLFLHLDEKDEYLAETAMIVSEILNQRIEGIKNEEGVVVTTAFPKLVYVLDENNALKGGEYDYVTRLAVKCTAKRMYPDYISAKKMREFKEGNVYSPMGCRSFLSPWKNEQGEYQFDGRFNQGVVTLNLPQIGILAQGDQEKFWELLEERTELCYKALMLRHNALKKVKSDSSPIHWQHGAIARLGKGESIAPYLMGGYSTISLGYIGIYEMTKLVIGESQTTEAGEKFSLAVLDFMSEKCKKWKAETNIGFALYGTPAESLCYRFARIDKELFGEIEDVTDKGYYTNSYHVDVREEIDVFSKFTLEAKFQEISAGGCISYVEVPNLTKNLEALEDMVKFIYDNIQYAEFNTKSDYCHECGFDGEIVVNSENQWECPSCQNNNRKRMTVIRRTCGYLGENFWNEGKTKEMALRVTHV